MEYLLLFLEGIVMFISPCLLPMLPIYISYFAGQNPEDNKKKTIINSLGFVLGFTVVFAILGAFAGSIGRLLLEYSTAFNIVTGLIVVLFGLNFMGAVKLPFINKTHNNQVKRREPGFFSSLLFGLVFSISWTPCAGVFLASALALAAQSATILNGIIMLLFFSLGLGLPFVASALLINKLKTTFDFIKRHYKVINIVSGSLLIVVGILMMTGVMQAFLLLLTF